MESFQSMKEMANTLFANKDYEAAIELYEQALGTDDGNLKAICLGNMSACYLLLNDINRALEYTASALEIKPDYTKVRERRIRILLDADQVREAKEESEKGEINPGLMAEVKAKSDALLEKEKDEMLGKLKDLGNTVLGKFGLNLNNFQVNQQEGGGYSVNFKN